MGAGVQPHAHYWSAKSRLALCGRHNPNADFIPDWDLRWQHVYLYGRVRCRKEDRGMRSGRQFAANRGTGSAPVRVIGEQSERDGRLWLKSSRKIRGRELLDKTLAAKWLANRCVGSKR